MSDDPFSPYPAPQSLAPISVSGESPFPPAEPEPSQPVEDLTRKFVSAQRSAPAPAPTPEFTPAPIPAQTPAPAPAPTPEFTPALVSTQIPVPAFAPAFATASTPGMDGDEILEQRALKTVVGIVIAVVAIFIIGGGGAWYFLARDTDDAEPPSQPAENLIIAEDGGEVSSKYGASVIIPPGALAEDTEIKISRVVPGDVTDRFELQPHGLAFLKPVTVLIPYKESGLKADKTARDIRLKYWSDDPNFGRENPSYTVNSEDKILSTKVTHF